MYCKKNPLPNDLLKEWINLLEKLRTLNKLVTHRAISKNIEENQVLRCEMHGFCDSSLKTYLAMVYLKVLTKEKYFVRLLSAKSKVAPHKTLTIPRLELLGCHLLSKLVDSVKRAIRMIVKVDEVYFWTDSEICLCWIKSVDKEWKAWVENRANAIRSLTDIDLWRFVPGDCNPSDIATRKGDFVDLGSNALFWNGPSFLMLDPSGWPKPKQSSSEAFDNIENVETHVVVSEDISNSDILVENLMKVKNFSSLEKLLLVTSYVLRFKNNSLAKIRKTPYTKGFISTKELKYAEKLWIYSNQRKIITSSKFSQLKKSLGIFYDNENILRVKGRLSNADVVYNVKHPILLHNELYFTELVVWSAHKRVLHGGVNNTLNFIRND